MKKLKDVRGITLISLVVTIIILLILAGISIGALTGDNGILNQAQNAKEQTEIGNEKEILKLAIIGTKENGESIIEEKLKNELIKLTSGEDIKVTNNNDGTFLVIFPSGRVYSVNENGNVEYLGKENELREKIIIMADKESNSVSEFVQNVELTVATVFPVEDSDIALLYAWTTSNEEEPTEEQYMTATLSGTKLRRTTIVSSTVTTKGNYYLWVKAISNEKETLEIFGQYSIRDYTTLKVCKSEYNASSYFLGSDKVNTNITRNAIKSITIEDSLQGYSVENSNCWDVSEKQDGSILAKYEETIIEGKAYYDIKIAGNEIIAANPNSSYLFAHVGYDSSQEVIITGLENLDTSFVTDISHMFWNCNKLIALDVSDFNTSKVTNMKFMFKGCTRLATLDVSNFDTSNVTTLYDMFSGCNSLRMIDVSNFNTSKVIIMQGLFDKCKSLESIDVSNFDTSKVTNMSWMFSECTSLTMLDIKNFNTNNVTNMWSIFKTCSVLTNLNVSDFNTSNVTNMNSMFAGCSKLTTIDVSNFNTSNVTNMRDMFSGCNSLATLDVSNFDTSKVTDMQGVFDKCKSLTQIDVSNFDTGKVTNMSWMFSVCTSLTTLDVSNFNTDNVKTMREMFNGCSSLTTLDVSKFNTSNVTNMSWMFSTCKSLTALDISNFNTNNVTTFEGMFGECSSLTSLDISGFIIKSDAVYNEIFNNVPNNTTIYVGSEDMQNWVLEQNSLFTNIQVKSSQEVTE